MLNYAQNMCGKLKKIIIIIVNFFKILHNAVSNRNKYTSSYCNY